MQTASPGKDNVILSFFYFQKIVQIQTEIL